MKIGLVAGETSGDLLGAGLIEALRERVPDAVFEGVAGPEMVAAGCQAWERAEALAVMGLVEPLKEIPRLLKLRRSLVARWSNTPPDVFVGIDAPDFNLRLEVRLRAAGIRTVHYVSPSIWAWRRGRIKTIKAAADRVLCLLPFEKPLYDDYGVDAVFVGHPKADSTPEHVDRMAARRAAGLPTSGQVVAVLPGSRESEVSRLAALFAASAQEISREHADVNFVTPVANRKLLPVIEGSIAAAGMAQTFTLLEGQSELAMSAADVVLLASGTAALESALLRKPTVAAYRVAPLTFAIVKAFGLLKISHVTLPNLLTETPLIPEFIQDDATPTRLAAAVGEFLLSPARRAAVEERFAKLRLELALGADQRAADAVLSLAD